MGENEKTENVLKRAHGDGVTPEKKRKVDDEGTHGDDLFRNSAVSATKKVESIFNPPVKQSRPKWRRRQKKQPFCLPRPFAFRHRSGSPNFLFMK